jgi:hypothetical protein
VDVILEPLQRWNSSCLLEILLKPRAAGLEADNRETELSDELCAAGLEADNRETALCDELCAAVEATRVVWSPDLHATVAFPPFNTAEVAFPGFDGRTALATPRKARRRPAPQRHISTVDLSEFGVVRVDSN